MKKLAIAFGLSFGICWNADAQNLKGNFGVESSHMPNFLKSQQGPQLVNVDLYTGTGSVTIPIHDYTVNTLDLGVSLSYLAKGVKVNQLSSSVGLGWDLNYGGSITREVYGLEDEITLPIVFPLTTDSMQGYMVPGSSPNSTTDIDDAEHDVFSCNIGGRSFDFVFDRVSGNIVYQTYPHSNIQISVLTKDVVGTGYGNVRNGFSKRTGFSADSNIVTFVVTDEYQNKFYFERGDYRRKQFKFPHGTFDVDSGYYYVTDKWNLTSVTTYDGYTVNYDYQKKYAAYLLNVSEHFYVDSDFYYGGPDPLAIINDYFVGYKTHISKITYPQGTTVTFDLDTTTNGRCDNKTDFRLKNIIVQTMDQNPITYRLNQAYFQNARLFISGNETPLVSACSSMVSLLYIPPGRNSDSMKESYLNRALRLKLKSIDIVGTNGTSVENYYSFGYNTTILPDRFSAQQDYYGYYNGIANVPLRRSNPSNTNLIDTLYLSIPYHTDASTYTYNNGVQTYNQSWGQDRSYNFTKAQAASLITIQNCSGGRDSIVYQNYSLTNPYCSYSRSTLYFQDNSVHGTINIGCDVDTKLEGDTCNDGLCIGKVIRKDGYSVQHTSTTEYTYENGQRFNRGGYTTMPNDVGHTSWDRMNYFIAPSPYFRGSNHGFGKVTVTQRGYNAKQLSKSITYFTNLMFKDALGNDTSCITGLTGDDYHSMPPAMLKYRLGLPTKIESYDQADFLFNKQELSYEYKIDPLTITNTRYFNLGTYRWVWQTKILDNEWLRMISKTDTDYTSTNKIANNHQFTYDSYNNVQSDARIDSKGDQYKTYIAYYNGVPNPIREETWKMISGDSLLTAIHIRGKWTDGSGYLHYPADYTGKFMKPLSSANAASKINRNNAFFLTSPYGDSLNKAKLVTLYDNHNHALETRINDKENYLSNIYDQNTGEKLAEANNAKYQDIAYTSFESNYSYGADYSKGNWNFSGPCDSYGGAMTGTQAYLLTTYDLTSNPLRHKRYVLSFWTYYTVSAVPEVDLMHGSTSTPLTLTLQNTVGNWEFYTAIITPDSGDYLSFTCNSNSTIPPGPVTYIDELKLYPIDASMTTYTYMPNIGMSTESDNSGYIKYYEYDEFGRLNNIRDLRGNIIKSKAIHCGNPYGTPTGGESGNGGPNY